MVNIDKKVTNKRNIVKQSFATVFIFCRKIMVVATTYVAKPNNLLQHNSFCRKRLFVNKHFLCVFTLFIVKCLSTNILYAKFQIFRTKYLSENVFSLFLIAIFKEILYY